MQCGLVLVLAIFGLQTAWTANNHICGNGHGQTPCVDLVDSAITNVELYYDDHLCHTIVDINCDDHHITGDEVLCGDDGKTYVNHCLFTVARCTRIIHGHNNLHIASVGPCPNTTTQAPAPATTQPPAQTTHANNGVSTTMAAVSGSTAQTMITTTTMPPTTTNAITTVDPIHGVIANVFCQQASTLDCNTGFNIICGSDGQYYPNDCELSKAKCINPALVKADPTVCAP